jgi:Ca2+ transporting ATPase
VIHKSIPESFTSAENANPYVISGTKLLVGTGDVLVLAVGINSQYGRIQSKLSLPDDETPLQQKLEMLANNIGKVGVVSAILTFSAMMVHLAIDIILSNDWKSYWSLNTLKIIVEFFTIAVSIIVVAVPEGLPLAVTIALAYSVGKMKDENNLVRYLSAC